MRLAVTVALIVAMGGGAAVVEARQRPIDELPKDIWDLAFVWTEPLKQVANQTRRRDPVRGLWFGLVDGSIRSVSRTTKFFLFPQYEPSRTPEAGKQFRYSF